MAEVARQERQEAQQRQEAAGVKPLRTNFRESDDRTLDAAVAKIWGAGKQSKVLYIKLGKGLSCLSKEDVIRLGDMDAEQIEAIAPELAAGATLKAINLKFKILRTICVY